MRVVSVVSIAMALMAMTQRANAAPRGEFGPTEPVCAAAEVVVVEASKDRDAPKFLSTPPWAPPKVTVEDVRAGWAGAGPSAALAAKFVATPLRTALACANASAAGGRLERELAKASEAGDRVQASLPVLSEDGSRALALVSVAPPRAGGATLLMFLGREEGGPWTLKAIRVLAVS